MAWCAPSRAAERLSRARSRPPGPSCAGRSPRSRVSSRAALPFPPSRARHRRAPAPGGRAAAGAGGGLPTTDELRGIRDRLHDRLFELDAERADVIRSLAELDLPEPE